MKAEKDGDVGLALSLRVPEFNVSYKPQMIAPKFKGYLLVLYLMANSSPILNLVAFCLR